MALGAQSLRRRRVDSPERFDRVEPGQLRRWVRGSADPHLSRAGEVFIVLDDNCARSETEACWNYLMNSRKYWEFEEVILDDSEVLSES